MPEICCKNAKILEQKMLELIKSNFPQMEYNKNLNQLISFDDTKFVNKLTNRIIQDFEYRKSDSL